MLFSRFASVSLAMNEPALFYEITVLLDPPLDGLTMQNLLSTIRSFPGVRSVTARGRLHDAPPDASTPNRADQHPPST